MYSEEKKGRLDYLGYIFPRQRGYDDTPAEDEQLITVQVRCDRACCGRRRRHTHLEESLLRRRGGRERPRSLHVYVVCAPLTDGVQGPSLFRAPVRVVSTCWLVPADAEILAESGENPHVQTRTMQAQLLCPPYTTASLASVEPPSNTYQCNAKYARALGNPVVRQYRRITVGGFPSKHQQQHHHRDLTSATAGVQPSMVTWIATTAQQLQDST